MDPQKKGHKNPGFLSEVVQYLVKNKKWWLMPIVVIFFFLSILIVLAGTSAAPFIYTLF